MSKLLLALLMTTPLYFSSFAKASEVETVKNVDLTKYVGTWYEVASIPQSFQKDCVKNTSAVYSLAEKGLIKVLNSCETSAKTRKVAEGRAQVVDTQTNSKLKVTFVKIFDWVFAFGGNYWILDLTSDYSYAIVGDPTRQYAWILSRTPDFSKENFIAAEKSLALQGYDTCKILTSVQDQGLSQRIPLCEYVK